MVTYFILALACAILSFVLMNDLKKIDLWSIIPSVLVGGIVLGVAYYFMPTVGWRFFFCYLAVAFATIIGLSFAEIFGGGNIAKKMKFCFAVLLLFTALYLVTTSTMCRVRQYRQLLQVEEVAEEKFSSDFVPTKPEEMIKVDLPLAAKYASAVLEQDAAIGSVCDLKKFYRQRLQNDIDVTLATGERKTLKLAGEIVYIAPLEHSSFMKWLARKVTPGFIIISAQRQNEVYFVKEINGNKLSLRYLESGCFGDNILRVIRKAGYTGGVTNLSVVLSPEGRLMATATLFAKTIGFSGEKVTGMLAVDVQTGEVVEYGVDEIPTWIDRVYPKGFIKKYIYYWGEYPKTQNFFKSFFTDEDARRVTPGMEAIYNGENRYYYTGIQSKGADDGTSGIIMVDSRSGKAIIYSLEGGSNEASTKEKFEKNYKIDAAEVISSEVIVYPVRGENLYFATLKGQSGDFLGYGVSSVKYRELVAVGKSIDEALLNYYVAKTKSSLDSQAISATNSVDGEYVVAATAIEDGIYYFLFNDVDGKEFMAPAKLSKELKWTKVGDKIQVSYSQTMASEQTIMLEKFENINFNF